MEGRGRSGLVWSHLARRRSSSNVRRAGRASQVERPSPRWPARQLPARQHEWGLWLPGWAVVGEVDAPHVRHPLEELKRKPVCRPGLAQLVEIAVKRREDEKRFWLEEKRRRAVVVCVPVVDVAELLAVRVGCTNSAAYPNPADLQGIE
jgi:hypothetical protein